MGDDTPEREMKDFQFRQMKKIRVFDSPDVLPTERSSLLAISNKFGLTFAGRDRTLKVFVTDDIIAAGSVSGNTNEIVESVTCQTVTLDLPMHHLALSSDELTLSVCGANEKTPLTLDFYDVRTFFNKTRQDKRPFASFRAGSEPDLLVQDLKWSPTEAFRLAVCLSDGTMMVVDVTEKVVPVGQLPASVGITCICWSPKGKQIAAGKQNATVVQYTPILQEKKVIPCPNFYTADNPVKVLDVLWLSTFNFAVAYAAADGSPETPPELVMVSLPKKDEKKEDKFVNFSDIVFGSCTERQHHYFLNHIEDWDLILAASAASIEVSIIAKQEDKTNWELWMLEDASRAELPVTLNNDDTFPVGVGIDYTNQAEIHISDEKKLPPAPTLLILSTDGVLCPFSLINLNPGVKQLVTAAECLPQSGERAPLQKSVPPTSVPAAPKPPPSVFAPFQTSSITPASTSAAPAAPSSTGLSFSLPSSSSSLFSFTPSSSSASIVPSAAGFSFTAPKPLGKDPSFPAFSFGPPSGKPLTEGTSAPGQVATATESPIILPKASAEPATPNVRVNLSDRFSAADTPAPPAPPAPSTQPFSFTSTPKPAAAPDMSAQPKPPVFPISKPPAAPAVTRPPPAQTSAPSAAVQKPAPAAPAPPPTPSTQLSSVKSVEKQLQQAKDSDPVMVGIQEEIAHFKKEMDELKARVRGSDFRVGSSDEMKELRKESEDLHGFTLEIKETTESMHGDISTLKTTLLEGFAGAEEARAQKELSRDKGYLQLLYKKPLDPRSENQLKEIRRLYQYVKFAVEDVNDVLDVEWEKHLEKKRKQRLMIVPEREALYTALANNMHIINQQKQKLEHLVRNLQTLRLYNRTSSQLASSSPSPSPSSSSQGLDSELESLKNALLKASLDTTHKGPSKSPFKMTPVKQSQLRNFLSKRQTPPVRSTAPANLSKSAFLSPKYFEDLDDDVSSTSSLYQSQEYDEPPSVREEPELPQPTLAPARHPAVVRTTSIQPQSVMASTPMFSEVPSWTAMPVAAREAPKMNMDGADSTALATKTVTHGPPPAGRTTPLEKATPTALNPAQAAARAALNRQLNSQKPMTSLTELMLKNVPQVVNVQELKDNRTIGPVLTDSGSSMTSSPADQSFQQIPATAEAKKNSTQTAVKVQLPVTESAPAQPSFVFGQLPKHDAAPPFSLTSSLELQSNKGASPGFQFNLSTLSSQAQGASASPSGPQSEKIPQKPAAPATSSKAEPSKSSAVPPFQVPRAQEETLGPFSELRVGPAGDGKETIKPSTTFTFKPAGSTGAAASFTFGNATKPAVAERDADSASAAADTPKNGIVFKPPESTASSLSSKTFSFTAASPASSFGSLLTVALPQETPSAPEEAPEPELSPPPPESTSTTTPIEEPPSEPSPEPPSALSMSSPSVAEEPSASQPKLEEPENPSTQTAPVPEATPTPTATSTPAETVPVTASTPVQETTPITTAGSAPVEQQQQPPPPPVPAVPAAEPAAPAVPAPPSTTTPGSIFTQPAVSSNSTTLSVTSFTPVISTAGISTSAPAQTPVFAQPVSTSTSTSVFESSGFGVPSTTSSFGKPVFGQSTSFGFGSASGFTFGQAALGGSPGFGQTAPASSAPAAASSSTAVSGGGGGGGLFGSASSTSASSFSFAPSGTNSGANTGPRIFGQGGGAPAFGQSGGTSGFGQPSLFGSNTATTTSASGFNFGQPSAPFGSTSSTPVFGQQPSNNSVFGQPSSGGSLFGSAAPSSSNPSGGGFFSGLGGKPSEDAANKNPFGTTSTGGFGQANQTGGNLFGNSGAKAFGFGGAAFGDQKASGTFSAGGGSVATQGFGSFSTPAKSGGFGSPPVFGSPPAFGGSPAFGGQATFGSTPAFNSPLGGGAAKVFGEGTSAASVGGFGFASPPSGPSFGSMANQNSAPTFGGLAQQGPGFGSQSAGFSGFGSSGGFGGFGNTNNNQSSSQTFGGWRS